MYDEAFQTLHLDHFYMGPNILFPQMTECLTIIDRKTSLFVAIPLPRLNFLYTWLALPDWKTATYTYVRILQRKHKLAPLYKGPFRIIDRHDRSMLLDIDGNLKRISYLHLHPLHFTPQDDSQVQPQVSYLNYKNIKMYSFFLKIYTESANEL